MHKEIVWTKTGKVFLEDSTEQYSGDGIGVSEKNGIGKWNSAVNNPYRALADLLLKDSKKSQQKAET